MRAVHFILIITVIGLATRYVVADDDTDQSKMIAKIELLGGKVSRDDTLPSRPVNRVDFSQSSPGENKRFNGKYLHLLNSFTSLATLDLTNSSIADHELKEIKGLKSLKILGLGGTKITDAGLKELGDLRSLTCLDLRERQVNDQGLKRRFGLSDLRSVELKTSLFTPEGIRHLKQSLPNLEIRLPVAGFCQPDRITLGTVHVGATVEASVRVFICGDKTAGIEMKTSPPPFVHVTQTRLGTQNYGNLGTFIYCDVGVSLNTNDAGEFNGPLTVHIGEKQVEIPVTASIHEKDSAATRVLIIETPFQRFSTDDASLFEPWLKIVTSANLDVSYLEVDRGLSILRDLKLSDFDVVLLGGDGIFFARDDDLEKLASFVESGGRVIVAANAFFRGTVEKANRLIVPLGLKMMDIEPQADSNLIEIKESDIPNHQLTTGVKELKFFRPSPITVEAPANGTILVQSKIFPQQGLVAVVTVGKGDIVVMGASLWWNWIASEQESRSDNARLLQNLMSKRVIK